MTVRPRSTRLGVAWLVVGAVVAALPIRAVATPPTDPSAPARRATVRIVATDNRVGHSEFRLLANATHVADYFPITIASGDVARFRLSWDGWFRVGGDEVSMSNAYSVRGSIQNGSVSVPFTRNGSRDVIVSPGDVDLQSDWIVPASFGLERFTKGETYWFKADRTYAAGAACIENGFETEQGQGYYLSRSIHYDPASTTLTPLDAVGPYGIARGGTGVTLFVEGYRPHALGEFVAGDPLTMGGIIDSLMASGNGNVESVGAGSQAPVGNPIQGGFGRVAAQSARGGPIAFFNLSRNGGTAQTTAKTQRYFRYFRVLIDEAGANDLGRGLAAFERGQQAVWAAARAAGVEQIVRTTILPRTDSNDGFKSGSGQSYQTAQFAPTGDAMAFDRWLAERVVDRSIDHLLPMLPVRDAADPFKWNSDGTVGRFTTDGTHPTAHATQRMAAEVAAVLNALPFDGAAAGIKREAPRR